MSKFIEVAARFNTLDENGSMVKKVEKYLVKADTFMEAETRVIKYFDLHSRYAEVDAVKKSNIVELVDIANVEDDTLYKVKISLITLDEKSGKEKHRFTYILIESSSIDNAIKAVREWMKGTISDYTILSVTESGINKVMV